MSLKIPATNVYCQNFKRQQAFLINTVIVYLQQLFGKTRKSTNHLDKLIGTPFGYNQKYRSCYLEQVLFEDFEMITFYQFWEMKIQKLMILEHKTPADVHSGN